MVGLVYCLAYSNSNIFSLTATVVEAMVRRQGCLWLFIILLASTLLACSSDGKKWNPDDYTVKSGDTVYSIAWRYELDPDEFAAWNNVPSSGLIKPGQRLHTRKPWNFDASRNTAGNDSSDSGYERSLAYAPAAESRSSSRSYPDKKWVKAEKGDSLYAISRRYGVSVAQLAQLNQLKKPYVIQPGQTIFLKPLSTPGQVAVNKAPAVSSRSATRPAAKSTAISSVKTQTIKWPATVKWSRPANGKLVKKFNRRRNDAKGIDIAGKLGDNILASADGKVVYSGDGLISYGNLIIIKHNKSFLSAYAYNHKLLVKEGESVVAGQKIAEMGRKDKLSPRLHFEIRKNGKPVDPLKYLAW